MTSFNEKVFYVVSKIPYGKVMTYGQIAAIIGNVRWSRMVGYAMHQIKEEDHLPWHRVVFKDGSVAFGEQSECNQYELLRVEKVSFTHEKKVKMKRHQWDAKELEEFFLAQELGIV